MEFQSEILVDTGMQRQIWEFVGKSCRAPTAPIVRGDSGMSFLALGEQENFSLRGSICAQFSCEGDSVNRSLA